MKVLRVHLKNFRNHRDTELGFGEGMNVLLGNNGQGKTNVLEAVSFLSLTKSFYAASDATVLQIGSGLFEVEGVIEADAGTEHTVRVAYAGDTGEKLVTINHARPESLSSVIGRFPVVVLSPENSSITFGGPADRRKFLDITLSQLSRVYFEDIIEYRRVLRQRNRILTEARATGADCTDLLAPWDVSLGAYGSRIMARRDRFVAEFQRYMCDAYRELVHSGETPAAEYAPSCPAAPGGDAAGYAAAMASRLDERRGEERRRGMTLIGPHRDDVRFTIGGLSLQRYASQGQHKTFLIALKVAEFFYLKERCSEVPLFLLDDVFSELDDTRSRHMVCLVAGLGQMVITTTDASAFHDTVTWNGKNRKFYVENGTCRQG